jgi:CheY-like chemotaxis protein
MTSHERPSPRTRVLVVEDQPTVSQIIAEVLEADGYEVETAANGLLALARQVLSTPWPGPERA